MTNTLDIQTRTRQAISTPVAWVLLAVIFAAVQIGSLFTPPLLDDADASHAQAAQHMAESGDWIGDEAVVHIVKYCNGVESGSYKFLPGASASTRTVLRSATELMLEALRELDEGAQDYVDGGFR